MNTFSVLFSTNHGSLLFQHLLQIYFCGFKNRLKASGERIPLNYFEFYLAWNWKCNGSKSANHLKHFAHLMIGCGSVDRAVASDARGLQFKFSHWQNLYWTYVNFQLYWKDENKGKEAGNGTIKNILLIFLLKIPSLIN